MNAAMAYIAKKFLPLIRFRSSFTFMARTPSYSNFQPLMTWMKDIHPLNLQYRIPSFRWKSYAHQFLRISGHEYSIWGILGCSVVLKSIGLYPRLAYSMNGSDALADKHHRMGLLDSSNSEDHFDFSGFVKKMVVPIFLLVTVWMNWGYPIVIVTKVFLVLFTTKPNPLSVYVFIDQLRHDYLRKLPIFYKYKQLYAKKVDVEDYVFLCVARVEMDGIKLTLIGILGGWWVMQLTPFEGEVSAMKKRVMSLRDKFEDVIEKL